MVGPANPRDDGQARRWAGSVLGAGLVAAFVAIGVATLPDYGITWDEGLGDLYFGDVYLEYFESGCDASLLPETGREAQPLAHWGRPGQPDIGRSPFRSQPAQHWPVGNLVVAACGAILDRRLHWLGPIDARHVGVVLLAALALAAVWTFAREVFGLEAAVAATVLLATYPEFFGQSHNVAKDIGECAFYGWTIVAFHRACSRRSRWWLVMAAVLLGLALGTKANAVFVPVTLALWLAIAGLMNVRSWWPRPPLWPWLMLLITIAAGLAIAVGAWPWLWRDPWGRLAEHYGLLRGIAGGGPDAWQVEPLRELVIRTPPTMLAFVLAGVLGLVAWSRARRQWSAALLVLLWVSVPLLRSAVPGYRNYDGIRRFLEVLPPFSILAGVGLAATGAALARWFPSRARRTVTGTLVVLAAAHAIWIDVRVHPHQTTYLNRWRGEQAPVDYWGSSYREAIEWVNAHAEQRASVVAPIAPWLLEIAAPVWFRPDLRVAPGNSVTISAGSPAPNEVIRPSIEEALRYVLLLNRPGWSDRVKAFLVENAREVHRIEVDGHPIVFVFALSQGG